MGKLRFLLLFAYLATSSLAFAHSQGPITFGGKSGKEKGVTLNRVVMIPIVVGAGEAATTFDITVDGNPKPYKRIQVMGGGELNVVVPVRLDKPNVVENHKVCSTATSGSFRTRICTRAKLYWLRS